MSTKPNWIVAIHPENKGAEVCIVSMILISHLASSDKYNLLRLNCLAGFLLVFTFRSFSDADLTQGFPIAHYY